MVKIRHTEHLSLRLKVRNFPHSYPNLIYENPDQKFFDFLEKTGIAVKKLIYNGKLRNIMIAYDKKDGYVEIITIHPISDEKILNRVLSGRWRKNE